MKSSYAGLKWHIEDVKTLARENGHGELTDRQARSWLCRNEKYIRDRLCEIGWGVMGALMHADPPKQQEEDGNGICDRDGRAEAHGKSAEPE
jgi:hypothetical protein